MEALLVQSAQGIHLLFDNSSIAAVMKKHSSEDFLTSDNLDKIQKTLKQLMQYRSLAEKRHFLTTLDQDSYELVIRTYFHIVDHAVLASTSLKH